MLVKSVRLKSQFLLKMLLERLSCKLLIVSGYGNTVDLFCCLMTVFACTGISVTQVDGSID